MSVESRGPLISAPRVLVSEREAIESRSTNSAVLAAQECSAPGAAGSGLAGPVSRIELTAI